MLYLSLIPIVVFKGTFFVKSSTLQPRSCISWKIEYIYENFKICSENKLISRIKLYNRE